MVMAPNERQQSGVDGRSRCPERHVQGFKISALTDSDVGTTVGLSAWRSDDRRILPGNCPEDAMSRPTVVLQRRLFARYPPGACLAFCVASRPVRPGLRAGPSSLISSRWRYTCAQHSLNYEIAASTHLGKADGTRLQSGSSRSAGSAWLPRKVIRPCTGRKAPTEKRL